AVAKAREAVPAEYRHDLSQRRLRNHVVNLAAMEMHAEGVIDCLVMTSDDTAPRGFPAAERHLLQQWNDRLDTSVPFYPGADEVPSVLVARVAAQHARRSPSIRVTCAESGGLERTAPYEDQPVGVSVRRQIGALGATIVADDSVGADLVLVVHAPAEVPGDWVMNPPEVVDQEQIDATTNLVRAELAAGSRVALADVRYANGSDPDLLTALDEAGLLGLLTAYGGWNTA